MKSILYFFRGIFSFTLLIINTIFWCTPLTLIAFFKLLIPISAWRRLCTRLLNFIAMLWTSVNNCCIDLFLPTKWHVRGFPALNKKKNYLIISNHCSGIDIVALQKIFNRRIPFFRFFLKKELIWIPILGLAWWALDYPFMKRYSRELITKKPNLKGKDLEITRKACAKYQKSPVSIMNFPEGTRFTPAKHKKQASPYAHLLKPKAGGIGYVLSAMGESVDTILNVTLVYPDGAPHFWNFLSGKIMRIVVDIEEIAVTANIRGDYLNDEYFRSDFQKWVNELWENKESLITTILRKEGS
ncbi:MAG: acyltransferase [Spirochaetes bacterium]|jgi:1-acyl-sn-glycerol-3-phosphate acyltransferase|nr:acyltransferase [Spirochaetota bacterium]